MVLFDKLMEWIKGKVKDQEPATFDIRILPGIVSGPTPIYVSDRALRFIGWRVQLSMQNSFRLAVGVDRVDQLLIPDKQPVCIHLNPGDSIWLIPNHTIDMWMIILRFEVVK